MLRKDQKIFSAAILILAFCFVSSYFISLQFCQKSLFSIDGYYHIAVSRFIKDFVLKYDFHWAQFSTFKSFFSDKDFLFHVLSVPFLYLFKNIILAAKFSAIFYMLLFFSVYVFILRKYLPNFLVGLFLFLLVLSPILSLYLLYLRPATLANILAILGVYFLINKRKRWLFAVSLLYSLSHISFFMLIVFALVSESLRFLYSKEFYLKNILVVVSAIVLGCFLHPNYPNNGLSIYLNGILVPLYTIFGKSIVFGGEFNTLGTKEIIFYNFAVFFLLNFAIYLKFLRNIKLSLPTLIWWGCSNIYLLLAFLGNRYWYQANIFFFIFFASFTKDWVGSRDWRDVLPKINIFLVICFLVFSVVFYFSAKLVADTIIDRGAVNSHYEKVSLWMKENIPAGETVYHSAWSDAPFFICLNPKNNYIVVLDPVYMFYSYPKEYKIYEYLMKGRIADSSKRIREVFGARYGYTNKNYGLYRRVKSDSEQFDILYEDSFGLVFKAIK